MIDWIRTNPEVSERAAAILTLLRDFRADCEALHRDELSRRCVDIIEAMTMVEERIAARQSTEVDE